MPRSNLHYPNLIVRKSINKVIVTNLRTNHLIAGNHSNDHQVFRFRNCEIRDRIIFRVSLTKISVYRSLRDRDC